MELRRKRERERERERKKHHKGVDCYRIEKEKREREKCLRDVCVCLITSKYCRKYYK